MRLRRLLGQGLAEEPRPNPLEARRDTPDEVAEPGVAEQPKQGASGKISTEVVDHTPVKKPSNGGTLQISRGEAPSAGGMAPAAQQTKKEEAVAKEKTVKEDQQRITQLEKQIQDMGKVQEMKKGGVVEMKSGVQPPASMPTAAASAPAHAKPKMTPRSALGGLFATALVRSHPSDIVFKNSSTTFGSKCLPLCSRR